MSAANDDVADADWDSALLAMNGHFLQSSHWQRVQRALGHDVLRRRGNGWMWMAAAREGRFPRYMYSPYGPASHSDAHAALESALETARGRRLDFVRVEPDGAPAHDALKRIGARRARAVQPRWTWLLDISASVDALRKGLSAGHRGSINAAERKGLRIQSSADPASIDVYIALQRIAGDRSGFAATPERYHRTVARTLMPAGAATMYIASHDDKPVAAALCFDFGATRYYAHAVSDPVAGRRLSAAAPLLWQALIDARSAGRSVFDFWGVQPDAPPGHPWAGFTRFKMAFGGHLVERAGTWEIPVSALRHRVYSLGRSLTRR